MKRFIFLLTITFLLLSCKKSEAQLDFVTEFWLAQNFTPKSGITPGTNNTLWMDCDQVLARYKVTISGVTSTGHRLPSKSEISSSVVYSCNFFTYGGKSYPDPTILNISLGSSAGLYVLNYNSGGSNNNKFEVYQNGVLKASTDYSVGGSFLRYGDGIWWPNTKPPIRFKYDPSNGTTGQIKAYTQSDFSGLWILEQECLTPYRSTYTTYTTNMRNYSYLYNFKSTGNYTLILDKYGSNSIGFPVKYKIHNATTDNLTGGGTVNSFPAAIQFTVPSTDDYIIDVYQTYSNNDTRCCGSLSILVNGCGDYPATSISSVSNVCAETAYVTYSASSDCPLSRAVCYSSTNTNPTTSDSHTSYTTETGSSTVQLTGLTPSTTYYVRSVAANAKGTTYSTATSFTTQAAQPYTGIIDLSASYEEDPQYYDVTFTATAQSAVQMNTTVYLVHTDPVDGTMYDIIVIPFGSTSSSVIVRYYRNAQYDVSCDFDNSYSVDFTYGTHPVYVIIPSL